MKINSQQWPLTILLLACFGYFVLMLSHISTAYLDFGDGNYLYISRRLLQGVVIYKDILSPQPPFHLFLGALLLKIGDILGNSLLFIRTFTILLRIIHAILIFQITRQIFKNDTLEFISRWTPTLSGIIYLFLPIGFWWSRGYQSEPLEILWMLLSLFFFIRFSKKGMLLAGIFSSFGVLTNMTAAPYLVLSILFLIVARRDMIIWFFLPVVLIIGSIVLLLQGYTSGMFLQNAIFDQVGTYPKENTLQYMMGKIQWIGKIILTLEGPLIFASLIGLFVFFQSRWSKKTYNSKATMYITFYMFATLGSFVFATKGGTVDYIFTLGEPAVAIFSSYFLIILGLVIIYAITKFSFQLSYIHHWLLAGMIVLLTLLFSIPGMIQNQKTLKGINCELTSDEMNEVITLIHQYAGPGDMIFAPPYFAFLADRTIVGEFSEQYVWFIKYINWIRYQEGNPNTLPALNQIGQQMAEKKIMIIFLNVGQIGQQTGRISPFRRAVNENYHPIGQIPMRNETLTIFLPNP